MLAEGALYGRRRNGGGIQRIRGTNGEIRHDWVNKICALLPSNSIAVLLSREGAIRLGQTGSRGQANRPREANKHGVGSTTKYLVTRTLNPSNYNAVKPTCGIAQSVVHLRQYALIRDGRRRTEERNSSGVGFLKSIMYLATGGRGSRDRLRSGITYM